MNDIQYMEFFRRNFGQPAQCFGQVHVDEVVEAFERIRREIFVEYSGPIVEKLRSMIEARFRNTGNAKDILAGWCSFPVSSGGLEVLNPIIQLLMVRESLVSEPEDKFRLAMEKDKEEYELAKTRWVL